MDPFSDLKTDKELGFSTVYDISNGNFSSLNSNLTVMNDYKDALISINSEMLEKKTDKINKRYFLETNQTCNGNNLHTVIDDMTYVKSTDGSNDILNYGLLKSAYGNLQSINIDNMNSNEVFDNCVEITMVMDENGNTDKKYVSINDYNKLNCNAFPNGCKTYTGKSGCEDCKKNEPFQNIDDSDLYDKNDINAKITYLSIAYLSALFVSFIILIKK